MYRIELSNLTKKFGEVSALAGLDLTVEAGESLVILGPSGSGKSTLLRLVAGLERPDEGDILFDGHSQLGTPPHRRGVAMVFQNFALYPHLTAYDNMAIGLRHGLKLPKDETRRRVHEVAETLEITPLLERRPSEMSGGQRQRVALGRALARNAQVVLLDEPLSGLDAQLRQELRVEIRTLLRAIGATTIFVTHDQVDAMAIGDRIAVMHQGKLVQLGHPEEIYNVPSSTFVARFIGTPPMNLLKADVRDGALHLASPARPISPSSLQNSPQVPLPDGPIWLGVRPEALVLDAKTDLQLQGRVLVLELSGQDWVVYLDVDGKRIAARATPSQKPQPGQTVTVGARAADLHFFAREEGTRVQPAQEFVT